jgi:hypothetical protein
VIIDVLQVNILGDLILFIRMFFSILLYKDKNKNWAWSSSEHLSPWGYYPTLPTRQPLIGRE